MEKLINNLSEGEAKEMLLSIMQTSYTLVQWPDSQELMDAEWFQEEAILDIDGSSAYFIPTWRLYEEQS
jgi:hypothetical protein